MNTNLPLFSKFEIESFKINEITDISNSFAKALGIKTTKRFSTKPKAIKRALDNQELYKDELPKTKVASKVKAKPEKSTEKPKETTSNYRKFEDTTLLKLGAVPVKVGTAMSLLITPVSNGKSVPAKTIINNFMKKYQQPRGFSTMDEKFARDYITGAIRKGHLKIVTKG